MSLLRRFLSWAIGESDEEERSLFDCLPIELYGEIFKHLDVENLKNCKAVCYSWTMGLSASRLLLKNTVSAWNCKMEIYNVINNETSLTQDDYYYFCNRVKIRAQYYDCENPMSPFRSASNGDLILTHFTQLDGFKFITYLEISRMTVTSDTLVPLVSEMELLVSLTATDIIYNVVSPYDNHLYPNPQWSNLKTLTIQIRCVWEGRDVEICTIGTYCTKLEYLNFQAFCNPTRFDIYSSVFEDVFLNFLRTMRKNSTTFESAVLDTFKINYDREFREYRQENWQEQIHEDHDRLFKRFLEIMGYTTVADDDWDALILVKKLHLGFQLVTTGIDRSRQFFLPFLRRLTDLKEFSLSQIHFPEDGRTTIQELQDCLPANCRTKFEGVMTIRMRYPQVPPPLYLVGWNMFSDFRGGLNYLQTPIDGYFDSTIGLYTANHSLMLRFVCCNSLDTIDFFTRNIQFLTKIKVDQSGAQFRHKIALDDGDMQRIIKLAIHLTDLCLEFCDLSAITDFGLTGISAEASVRMILTGNFELLDGDRVGIPVCGLRNLRSLKLSSVGNQVTDVTAHHAFKGLNSLTSFGISKPQMTSNGFQEIRRLFEFNQVVQIDPYTKYHTSSILLVLKER